MQGVSIFGDILGWFEKQNGWWPGWVCFLLMFIVNVSLFLPGVALILGAGFVFGYATAESHSSCAHPRKLRLHTINLFVVTMLESAHSVTRLRSPSYECL